MHSILASALCLSLVALAPTVQARSTEGQVDNVQQPRRWYDRLFRKDVRSRQEVCYEDTWSELVRNSTQGQDFCASFLNRPTGTVYADYTPVATARSPGTTTTVTATVNEILTPTSTVTVGPPATTLQQRDALDDAVVLRLGQSEFVNRIRQRVAAASNATLDDAAVSQSLSSACACETYADPQVTSTFTHATTTTTTIAGIARTTTTLTITRTAEAAITTVSLLSTPPIASSNPPPSTTGNASTRPTALPFRCPEDDETTVSQMVGTARFDYKIQCDLEISAPNSYIGLVYSSFEECAGACSAADSLFGVDAVCQGVSWSAQVDANGYNCYMKPYANETLARVGVHSARLQRIARGISNSTVDGTTTQLVAPEAQTLPPASVSSMVSSVLANSTTSMPLITPGPSTPPSGIAYSTSFINGTVYSTGTRFESVWTVGSVWYSTFFETWQIVSSSAAIVYASFSGSNGSGGSSQNITQVTQVIHGDGTIVERNQTDVVFTYPNGTVVTSEFITSATYNTAGSSIGGGSTVSIITGESGGSNGGASGVITGAVPDATLTPTISLSTSIFNGSSVYSSGGVVSTSYFVSSTVYTYTLGGNGTEYGSAASGSLPTQAPRTSVTVIPFSTVLASASSTLISGLVSATTAVISPAPSSVTVINGTLTTIYSSGYMASAILNSTASASSAIASAPIQSPPPGFSDINASRSRGYGSSTVASGSGLLSSPSASYPYGPFNSSYGVPTESIAPSSSTNTPRNPGTGSSNSIPPFPTTIPGYSPPAASYPTAPIVTAPVGTNSSTSVQTASDGYPPFVAPSGSRTRGSGSSSTLRNGTFPVPTATAPYPTGGTAVIPSGTGPVGTAPSGYPQFNGTIVPSSTLGCITSTIYLGTTTITATSTVLGCAESCAPVGGYGFAPQSFGPPVVPAAPAQTQT